MSDTYEHITLRQDNGSDLTFDGRLFSECSWFDEHEEQLVKQRLYVTDTNEQVYHIVRSTQTEKSHHAYRFSVNGDTCVINNGKDTISLQFDMLMELVKSLTGISENEVPTLAEIDEQERKISNG